MRKIYFLIPTLLLLAGMVWALGFAQACKLIFVFTCVAVLISLLLIVPISFKRLSKEEADADNYPDW